MGLPVVPEQKPEVRGELNIDALVGADVNTSDPQFEPTQDLQKAEEQKPAETKLTEAATTAKPEVTTATETLDDEVAKLRATYGDDPAKLLQIIRDSNRGVSALQNQLNLMTQLAQANMSRPKREEVQPQVIPPPQPAQTPAQIKEEKKRQKRQYDEAMASAAWERFNGEQVSPAQSFSTLDDTLGVDELRQQIESLNPQEIMNMMNEFKALKEERAAEKQATQERAAKELEQTNLAEIDRQALQLRIELAERMNDQPNLHRLKAMKKDEPLPDADFFIVQDTLKTMTDLVTRTFGKVDRWTPELFEFAQYKLNPNKQANNAATQARTETLKQVINNGGGQVSMPVSSDGKIDLAVKAPIDLSKYNDKKEVFNAMLGVPVEQLDQLLKERGLD